MSLLERAVRRLMPLPEVLEPRKAVPRRSRPASPRGYGPRWLPDQHGPDPVVFGSVPRVSGRGW